MSDTVITVENLSKKYTIPPQNGRHRDDGLRHLLQDAALAPWRWLRKAIGLNGANGNSNSHLPAPRSLLPASSREDFWALRDINLKVKQGEVVGIIGRNGAGKSTLLKILSRITEPTAGQVRIKGRVASLLEVGTGFHPELTGRENIFLNGAILGMTRAEIRRKFDEIVAFAEVEKFLEMPVKRYSSGMYVRLAFAVAAHLEPEILIVDEVLAVGDAAFQKKCLGKMSVVATGGRTVLFVSHQIAAVTRLCKQVLWLNDGRVKAYGRADLTCSHYLANGSSVSARRVWTDRQAAPGDDWVRLECVQLLVNGEPTDSIDIRSAIDISVTYHVLKNGKVLIPNIHFYADDGTLIFISHDWYSGWRTKPKPLGRYQTTFMVPGNFFSEGRVIVKVAIGTYRPFEVHLEEPDVLAFTVVDAMEGETSRGDYAGPLPGVVRPLLASRTQVIHQCPSA
jgi:lipopolysaccharide transport system ATP-binding protein